MKNLGMEIRSGLADRTERINEEIKEGRKEEKKEGIRESIKRENREREQ